MEVNNVFAFVNSASYDKKEYEEIRAEYNSFLVNRAFSYFPDSLFLASELQKLRINDKMNYDYYKYSLVKKKRFSKWAKKKFQDIDKIMKVLKISHHEAVSLLEVLTEEDLKEIVNKYNDEV